MSTFLDACLGDKRSLRQLRELAFYDVERDMPLAERFALNVGGKHRIFLDVETNKKRSRLCHS